MMATEGKGREKNREKAKKQKEPGMRDKRILNTSLPRGGGGGVWGGFKSVGGDQKKKSDPPAYLKTRFFGGGGWGNLDIERERQTKTVERGGERLSQGDGQTGFLTLII